MRENIFANKKIWLVRRLSFLFGPKKMSYLKFFLSALSNPHKKIMYFSSLKKYSAEETQIKYDKKAWKRGFRRLLLSSNEDRFIEMIKHFYSDEIILCKKCEKYLDSDLTVVCAVKNDLVRMKAFIDHYKKLGAKHFIIVDNGSEDGTYEFLKEQEEVTLYLTREKYNSVAKAAWINKVIAYNGLHKWYLVLDSDEFFQYPEMDKLNLNVYVSKLEQKKIYALKAIMIEPYPKGNLMSDELCADNFLDDYCYFDGDASEYHCDEAMGRYSGGIHERIFGLKHTTRSKIPLVFYTENRFEVGSHDIYPLNECISAPMGAVLMHYKFLPGEGEKIRRIIKEGNYANDSRLYKRYAERLKNGDLCAYYEDSKKWEGVSSFEYLPFIHSCTDKIEGKSRLEK